MSFFSTGIIDVKKEGYLRMGNGRVVFDELQAKYSVSAYTQDGRLIKDFKADANGTAIVVGVLTMPRTFR